MRVARVITKVPHPTGGVEQRKPTGSDTVVSYRPATGDLGGALRAGRQTRSAISDLRSGTVSVRRDAAGQEMRHVRRDVSGAGACLGVLPRLFGDITWAARRGKCDKQAALFREEKHER